MNQWIFASDRACRGMDGHHGRPDGRQVSRAAGWEMEHLSAAQSVNTGPLCAWHVTSPETTHPAGLGRGVAYLLR